VRIVLAEDGALLREGLIGLLERFDHEVVAAVSDAESLISAVDEHRPAIVITDVRMPPSFTDEGLRAAVRLRSAHPSLGVLVLSQYVAEAYAAELLDSTGGGGLGYLLKDRVSDVAEFIATMGRVAGGETVIDPVVVRQMLRRHRDPLENLTPREHEVLGLMAEGLSNNAISRQLKVTEAAISKHIANIFSKLDIVPNGEHNRRVLAVLTCLRHVPETS